MKRWNVVLEEGIGINNKEAFRKNQEKGVYSDMVSDLSEIEQDLMFDATAVY